MAFQRYRPATAVTLDTIAALNRASRPNMTFSGLTVTEECAKVGYLLNTMHPDSSDHVTYFGNSFEEAVSGAVRLVRHLCKVDRVGDPQSWILVVDDDSRLRNYFDPLDEGAEHALARHMMFARTAAEAIDLLDERPWAAVFVVAGPDDRRESVLAEAKSRRLLRLFCDPRELPDRADWQRPDADVYIYGENLTEFQVPFGCYVMTRSAYQVWNNPIDAMAQVSTFAASATALTLVLQTLRDRGFVAARNADVLRRVDESRSARNECYRRFVNPSSGDLQEGFGIDYEVATANGMTLRLRDGTAYIDCASGSGSNLRGHNPVELPAELGRHDTTVDYSALLADYLCEKTPFDVVLPAVSGATSVENALLLARLARPDRPRIVTLRGNFSGKTIPSLNVSRYGPQRSSSIAGAYEPYYPDVVFVDPFAADAAARLAEALDDPAVGLFWAELIQGTTCIPIPEHLMAVICDSRRRRGFLVGVDEVLTGVWRSSERFLYHTGLLDHADLAALAKPLSDMTIPIAAALAKQQVLDDAMVTNADAVRRLCEQYRNNLSAHIAWQALRSVDTPEGHRIRRHELEVLRSGLDRAIERSAAFASVQGCGSHIRILLNRKFFPFRDGTPMAELVDQMVVELILRRTGIALGRGRFFPPIFPPPGSMSEVADRLEAGLPRVTVTAIYRMLIVKMTRLIAHFARRRFTANSFD